MAAELDVRAVGSPWIDSLGAFASTGSRIIYASGMAEDAAPDAAPDLWQIDDSVDATPRVVWRNPERDHSIVVLAGSFGSMAWVDMPTDGSRAWRLWFWPEGLDEPMLLDEHPGDPAVSGLVPSLAVQEDRLVWTAFDAAPDGRPRSRLLAASGPTWEPRLQLERLADEAELWFPDLSASRLVFTEVRYAADRLSDERHVYLMELDDPASMRRLDSSGRATMPVFAGDAVVWKEADPGFHMLNWGKLFRYDLASGEVRPLSTGPVDYVNSPSAGNRFIAWWAADSFTFAVYDHWRGHPRLVERYPTDSYGNVLRVHVEGDLMAWLYTDELRPEGGSAELRWAWMPFPKDLGP